VRQINVYRKGDIQILEQRGIDPGHDVLQITANPFEPQVSESGEESARHRRQIRFRVTMRGFESNNEFLEPRQRGEASDHGLG